MPQQFAFPLPENWRDILSLINDSRTDLRLTVVHPSGGVEGYFTAEYSIRRIRDSATPLALAIAETLLQMPAAADSSESEDGGEAAGTYHILNGSMDDAIVIAVLDSRAQTATFLRGCFLGVFGGQRIEKIHEMVPARWENTP